MHTYQDCRAKFFFPIIFALREQSSVEILATQKGDWLVCRLGVDLICKYTPKRECYLKPYFTEKLVNKDFVLGGFDHLKL